MSNTEEVEPEEYSGRRTRKRTIDEVKENADLLLQGGILFYIILRSL
jgi:hypothetical protein